MSIEEEKTDKEVYDMCEHLKELYDIKDIELEKIKDENLELKKIIMTCFGTVRLLDPQWNNIMLDPETNCYIIESLRSYLNSIIEYEILNIA
tara:strand:- start:2708 stop:2983 length:276 start_codon:yes stop_codon:yes gene_type:complete